MRRPPTTRPRRTRRRRPVLAAVLAPAALSVALATPAGADATGGPRVVVPAAVARAVAPVPASAPTPAAALAAHTPSGATHVVVPGETLSGIATRHGTSVAAVAAANGLADPDLVVAGTTLTIPAAAAAPAGGGDGGGGGGGDLPERLQASPERLALIPTFDHWAARNAIPADLLKAVTWLESGWQQHQVSSTGAVGIGQLMPDTVAFMRQLIGRDLDPTVAEDNIRMSARYLRWLLARYPTAAEALAGYYQGPTSVARDGTYAETDRYVADVLALRARF